MKQMGLFGITISEDYGGLGLDHLALASIFEELSKGWMSLSGVIGPHHIMASIISEHGTDRSALILVFIIVSEILRIFNKFECIKDIINNVLISED